MSVFGVVCPKGHVARVEGHQAGTTVRADCPQCGKATTADLGLICLRRSGRQIKRWGAPTDLKLWHIAYRNPLAPHREGSFPIVAGFDLQLAAKHVFTPSYDERGMPIGFCNSVTGTSFKSAHNWQEANEVGKAINRITVRAPAAPPPPPEPALPQTPPEPQPVFLCVECGHRYEGGLRRCPRCGADTENGTAASSLPDAVRVTSPDGEPIRTLDDWRRLAPPRSPDQWRAGRSAMEVARAWLPGILPAEVADLFARHAAFADLELRAIGAEHETPLDEHRGATRTHDLLCEAAAGGRAVVIGVEAKCDETFGPVVATHVGRAPERSRIPDRVDRMAETLFGRPLRTAAGLDEEISALRYQLLTAAAGTAIEASRRNADVAILLIHELSAEGSPKRLQENAADLERFLAALTLRPNSEMVSTEHGALAGPFQIHTPMPGSTTPELHIAAAVRPVAAP